MVQVQIYEVGNTDLNMIFGNTLFFLITGSTGVRKAATKYCAVQRAICDLYRRVP